MSNFQECYYHLTDAEKKANKAAIAKGEAAPHKPHYFTKADGKGKEIDTAVNRVASAGRGLYFTIPKASSNEAQDAFDKFVKQHRVQALAAGKKGRISKAAVALDAIENMINSQYGWEKEQAEKALSILYAKLDGVRSKFDSYFAAQASGGRKRKGASEPKGYDISL